MNTSRPHLPHALATRPRSAAQPEPWSTQLRWRGAAAVIGFAVPFLASSVLDLHHDVYLGIYFAAVLSLFAAYARQTELDVRATLARNWKLGAVLGIYGAVDALLLTVLPCLVVYRALGGPLATWRRRLTYFGASLVLVLTMTAIYHLGYEQYREDGIGAPETGNTIISLPMLPSATPIGSVADHAAMHVSAVIHSYETEGRLPRQRRPASRHAHRDRAVAGPWAG